MGQHVPLIQCALVCAIQFRNISFCLPDIHPCPFSPLKGKSYYLTPLLHLFFWLCHLNPVRGDPNTATGKRGPARESQQSPLKARTFVGQRRGGLLAAKKDPASRVEEISGSQRGTQLDRRKQVACHGWERGPPEGRCQALGCGLALARLSLQSASSKEGRNRLATSRLGE